MRHGGAYCKLRVSMCDIKIKAIYMYMYIVDRMQLL